MSCFYCRKRPTAKRSLAEDKPVVKKVTFNETVSVIYFNKIPVVSDVCWQRVARDRLRFRRRMLDVERKIGWAFAPLHRHRMFKMLYM